MARKSTGIAKRARAAAEKWQSHFQFNINQYHEQFNFILGQQWTDDESDVLKSYKKVPLQCNKLGTMANGLLGEQQQNTPQLQVVPMENCDEQTAYIYELLVKDIMFSANSKDAIQIAAKQAIIGGFGAFAVTTDYTDPKSFDQNIEYISFKDPTKCYWDISAEKIDKTDGMHAGWLTRMSRKKFRDLYGKAIEKKVLPDSTDISASKAEIARVTATDSTSVQFVWADEDMVTIQDHFEKESVPETLYKLSNGRTVNQEELDEIIVNSQKVNQEMQQEQMMQQMMSQEQGMQQDPTQQQAPGMQAPEQQQQTPMQPQEQQSPDVMTLYDEQTPVRIEDQKETFKHIVKHYKICGDYELEQTISNAEQMTLVFMDQNSFYDKNVKQVCRPFFIDAKDAQKYINYLATQSAYVLKVSRFDQWIGSKKNVQSQDTQAIWKDPLTIQGMLIFDESTSGVIPTRVNPPELSQSLLTQYQRAVEDLYTSTGLYPTRMGQAGNEISGAAIDARTRQGSYSTYTVFNSINRAIAKGGEIVNEMIPKVYDTQRVISLMSPDKGQITVILNEQQDEYGEKIKNDIRKGSYQVKLLPGPSYEGQKQEALNSLNAAIQTNPDIFPLIADLYAENLPLANTIELKNRLKTLVPPEIIQAGKTGQSMPQQAQKPDPMQQFQQAQLQLKMQDNELKRQDLALKAQKQTHDAQMEEQRLENERVILAGQLQKQELEYMGETHRTNSDAAVAHADNMTKILTQRMQ